MSRRKFSVSPAVGPNADINVTPLVDVVLVLLIIFMVVTPLLEKDLMVHVPQTQAVDIASEVSAQVVVAINASGALTINSEPVRDDEYVPRLKSLLADQRERVVFFATDELTPYGRLIKALDGAKEAGAQVLGLTTE